MKEVTDKNFGVVIAFWLPGFVLLYGISFLSTEIATFLGSSKDASVGGFLYTTLACLALGLLISAVRWLFVDHFLYCFFFCFARLPKINFSKLKDKDVFAAFQGIVENHYRYYQYYSNTLVAIILAFSTYLVFGTQRPTSTVWLAVLGLSFTLLLASGDCLRKYFVRASDITT